MSEGYTQGRPHDNGSREIGVRQLQTKGYSIAGQHQSWKRKKEPSLESSEQSPADSLILNFSRPELWENIFLLVLRWWDCVTAALGNEYSLWNQLRASPEQLPWNRPVRPLNIIHGHECLPPLIRTEPRQAEPSAASVPLLVGPEIRVASISLEPAGQPALWVPGTTKGDAFSPSWLGIRFSSVEPERFLFHQVSSI